MDFGNRKYIFLSLRNSMGLLECRFLSLVILGKLYFDGLKLILCFYVLEFNF